MAERKDNPQDGSPSQPEIEKLMALYKAGRFEEAAAAARAFTTLWPGRTIGWTTLASALRALGRFDEAVDAARRAAELSPEAAIPQSNLGVILEASGDSEAAEGAYRQAIARDPNFAEAHFNLGNLLKRLGHLQGAEAAYRKTVEILPDHANAWSRLGDTLWDMAQPTEALAARRRVVQILPDSAVGHYALGLALRDTGRQKEAEASLRRAVELRPEYAEAHNERGVVLRAMGRFEEAQKSFRLSIACSDRPSIGYYNLSLMKSFRPDDPDLTIIKERLAQTETPDEEKSWLHFAAGTAYAGIDGHEDYAFDHFVRGNRLKRQNLKYDVAHDVAYIANIARRFDSHQLSVLGECGDPTQTPIFIVGMPRSGSSLVEQILASHPAIIGSGELMNFQKLTDAMGTRHRVAFPNWIADCSAADVTRIGEAYRTQVISPAFGAARVSDKMPGNFLFAGLISLTLPNARIIHVRRNPADTCLSCFMMLFSHGQDFTYDLRDIGLYYRAYAELMDHWRSTLPDTMLLDVNYEDMVANQEAVSRELIAFCGLEWHPDCLNFHQTRRAVNTASSDQVRRPMYKNAVERWKAYRHHLEPLFEALGPLAPV